MKTMLFITMILSLNMCLSLPALAEDSPVRHPVLTQWLGEWDSSSSFRESAWFPKENTIEGGMENSWTLEGQYLQMLAWNDLNEGRQMLQYDAATDSFLMWSFNSGGQTSFWIGKWNEAERVMHWELQASPFKGVMEEQFVGDDEIEALIVMHDDNGTLLLKVEVTYTRR